MKKLFWVLLICLLMALPICAMGETTYVCGRYEYILQQDGTAKIVGDLYEGHILFHVLPQTLDGYPVTAVGNIGFSDHSTIPYIPASIQYVEEAPLIADFDQYVIGEDHPTLEIADCAVIEKESRRLICFPIGMDVLEFTVPEGTVCIEDGAFNRCNIGRLTFPASLQTVGKGAFSDCNISSLILSEGMTTFENNGFRGTVEHVHLPSSLEGISGFYWMSPYFEEAWHLKRITVAENHPSWEAVDGVLFDKNEKMLIYYPRGREGDVYIVPEGTLAIDGYAFSCSALSRIILPEGLEQIGWRAFLGCGNLTEMDIPASVTMLGDAIFQDCYHLTRLSIPFYEKNTFSSGLFGERIYSSVRPYETYRLKEVTVLEGSRLIPRQAFGGATMLEKISIPDSVASFEEGAFLDCSSLKKIDIPEGATYIANYTFSGCSGLTEIEIPDGVTSIGDAAFSRCNGLTEVIIPESVIYLGNKVFKDCTGLKTLVILSDTNEIYQLFPGCTNLERVVMNGHLKGRNPEYQTLNDELLGCWALKEIYLATGLSPEEYEQEKDAYQRDIAILEESLETLDSDITAGVVPPALTASRYNEWKEKLSGKAKKQFMSSYSKHSYHDMLKRWNGTEGDRQIYKEIMDMCPSLANEDTVLYILKDIKREMRITIAGYLAEVGYTRADYLQDLENVAPKYIQYRQKKKMRVSRGMEDGKVFIRVEFVPVGDPIPYVQLPQ